MGKCCSRGREEPEQQQKFIKGGDNDVSEGPVTKRSCTDVCCIFIFLAAQVAFIVVTIAGLADGDPAKLYRPRDHRGAYCGVAENWNGGPNLEHVAKLSYTMNVTSTVDEMMKQLVCSSVAKTALVTGSAAVSPLLATAGEREKYLCDCCLIPCKKCLGSLEVGGDLTTGASLSSTISARMSELTDPSQSSSLFSPSGANGAMFSTTAFWEEATKYFNMVCLPDCNTNFETVNASDAPRTYTYTPSKDSDLYGVWNAMLNATSNVLTEVLLDTISTAFTFDALPLSVCPYEASLCVPMPGIEFSELTSGSDYCTFQMAAEVISTVGSVAASAFETLGGASFSSSATETFGKWVGDFQQTIDSFVIVSAIGFVIGLVFLILLRLFVGCCVWIAIALTIAMFAIGGAFAFVRSGQCQGADFFETGQQAAVAVAIAGASAAANAVSGKEAVSEAMDPDGDGQDYRGIQHYSKSGKSCVAWETQVVIPRYRPANYPNASLSANYCRNPYNDTESHRAKTIWCPTSDLATVWEECLPIGVIQPACKHGYAVQGENMRLGLYYAAFVIWALGGLWIIIIICLVSRIRLAIALNKVGVVFLASNPHILIVPVVQALVGIGWTIAWLYAASFLLSQVPNSYTPKGYFATYAEAYGTSSSCAFWEFGDACQGTPGKCNDKWPTGEVWKDDACEMDGTVAKCWRCFPPRYVLDLRFAVSFFVFLWNNAFNVALGQCIIAMAVSVWFFSMQKGKTPVVLRAVKTVFRYHIGSIAFGSFIVALVQFIRYLMKYFEKQAQAQKNRVMVLVLKVVQVCIWCFEKCIQFLNKNAYIQIALLGKPFCTSAKQAFFLILRNALRFGTVAILGNAIRYVGVLCITSSTVVVGYLIVRAMHEDVSPLMPCIFYMVMGYVVAKLYMNVFGLAVDASLQCFLAVEEMGGGGEYVPAVLTSFVGAKVKPKEEVKGE